MTAGFATISVLPSTADACRAYNDAPEISMWLPEALTESFEVILVIWEDGCEMTRV